MKFLHTTGSIYLALFVSIKATSVTADSNLGVVPTKPGVNRILRAANSVTEEGDAERAVNIGSIVRASTRAKFGGIPSGPKVSTNKLLESKQFQSWHEYMIMIHGVHAETVMIPTLLARHGDDGLTKILAAARAVPETRKVAKKLQMAYRLSKNDISAENAFVLLKLDGDVNKMLASPKLDIFLNYVKRVNKWKHGKRKSPIDIMTDTYGDEVLAKAIEAAKHVERTSERATKLQNAQFTMWIKQGAKQHQIWKMLNMDKKTWMTNPDAQVWYGYKAFIKLQKVLAARKKRHL